VFVISAQIGARLFVLRDGTMIILSPADGIKKTNYHILVKALTVSAEWIIEFAK